MTLGTIFIFWGSILSIAGIISLFVYEVKKRQLDQIDEETRQKNVQIHFELQSLSSQKKTLEDLITRHKEEYESLLAEKEEAQRRYDELNVNFSNYCDLLSKACEEERDKYQAEYQQVLADSAKEYKKKMAEIEIDVQTKQQELKDLRDKVDTIVDALKKTEAEKIDRDFYRVQIPSEDLQEIAELRDVAAHLRSKDLLNKLIYKEYYERPCTDLIGRVVGQKVVSGIYKISNINDGRCYVGQSVNIKERFKQHFKRGLGVEPVSSNIKLYEAIKSEGLQNFTFEILEECPYNMLNEREQYWQEVFHAKDFGYSIK